MRNLDRRNSQKNGKFLKNQTRFAQKYLLKGSFGEKPSLYGPSPVRVQITFIYLQAQPGPSVRQVFTGFGRRYSQNLGCLLTGKSCKNEQFDKISLSPILLCEFFKCFIKSEQIVWRNILRSNEYGFVKLDSLSIASSSETLLLPGVLDEYPSHCFSRCLKEVPPAVPSFILHSNQPEICFVHECRCLKCLAGQFLRHFPSGKKTQLVIDQGKQLLRSPGITLLDGVQDSCNIAHDRSIIRTSQ